MINLKRENTIPLHFLTPRFTVRRYMLEDDEALFEAATESIDQVYRFLPWCHPNYSIEDSRGWLRTIKSSWRDKQAYAFAITDEATGRLLGGCGLNTIDENPVANLGYWVRTSEINRGIASEATRGLLNFGFEHLGLIRIEIMMSTRNPASQNVAINAHAKLEGRLRNRLQLHGEIHDALLYSLVPKDMITDRSSH